MVTRKVTALKMIFLGLLKDIVSQSFNEISN